MDNRLAQFEAMLAAVQTNYDTTVRKMEQLKQAGKEKSATFRQLWGDKMMYQNMLTMYRVYGLTDGEKHDVQ